MVELWSGTLQALALGVTAAIQSASVEPNPAERATVTLEATEPVVVGVYRLPQRTGGERPSRARPFSPLCKAPCSAELQLGNHELAVLRTGEEPLLAFPAFRLSGPATLKLDVISHEADRTLGFWLTVISIPVGLAVTGVGLIPTCGDDDSCARYASLGIWGGIGIAAFGGTFGVPLMLRDDEVVLSVQPPPGAAGFSKSF